MEKKFTTKLIRNFVIISHIDHGKSTLADRFLEITNTIPEEKAMPQYLDSMPLEREKGITIKMHPCRMRYSFGGENYILNLIDTPGHIDFSYEISRALACVEGAILLVDATKGIQAQTIFNLEMAKKENLKIIGALNKIDVSWADISRNKKELASLLGVDEKDIFELSAKQGTNVEKILSAVINQIPPPAGLSSKMKNFPSETGSSGFSALVFDSKYDQFSGVIAYVRVFEGRIKPGSEIYFIAKKVKSKVKEVGYFKPNLEPSNSLEEGEIGYIKTDIKEPSKVKVGDTICLYSEFQKNPEKVLPILSYKEPQLVLYLSLFPQDSNEYEMLRTALYKLKLNDPALDFQPESKMALGRGFRCGFLGSLHAQIVIGRLKQEYGLSLIATSPQPVFKVLTKKKEELTVYSPSDWPEASSIERVKEPWVEVDILTGQKFSEKIFSLMKDFESEIKESNMMGIDKILIKAEAPLREIIGGNFYDKIKGVSKGYASFTFKQIGYRDGDLVKIDILIAGNKEDAFSMIVPRQRAFTKAKEFLQKLKNNLPLQQFAVPLQASLYGKIIARETIKALRKDVTAPLYGGDVTRKRKLLEKQKKGKKKLKEKGKINIPAQTFLEMLKG